MPGFSTIRPQVFRQTTPRTLTDDLSARLMRIGTSPAPVQSAGEGIARALQGVTGAYVAGKGIERDKERRQAYQDTLARALGGGPGVAPEEAANVPNLSIAQILAGNPDTAAFGLQLELADRSRQQGREDFLFQQENKAFPPTKATLPKTVDVGGRVHILNPDGSLGTDLGAEDRYVPVPGVGVFDPTAGTYIGQGAAPATSGRLPSPSADPTIKLPPAKRGGAQADELKTGLAEIAKDRASLSETLKIAEAAKRFGELLNVQDTGGALRNIPGAQAIEGAFDPEIKEMASLIDRITPLMRQGLPGAASERDTAMFRGAAFGTDKDPQTNRNLILGFQTSAQIAQDRVAFKDAYLSQNGSLRGAETQWLKYLEDNPIFDLGSDVRSPQLNQSRQTWQDYFSGAERPAATGFKVRKIK